MSEIKSAEEEVAKKSSIGKKKENKETVTCNLGRDPVTWETVIFCLLAPGGA
jgi:hypothetical protein